MRLVAGWEVIIEVGVRIGSSAWGTKSSVRRFFAFSQKLKKRLLTFHFSSRQLQESKNDIALRKLHANHHRSPPDIALHLLLPPLPVARHRRRPPRHVVSPRRRGRRGIHGIRPLPRGSIDVRPLPHGSGVKRAAFGGDTEETRRQISERDNSASLQDEGFRFIQYAGQGVVDGDEKVIG